MDQLPELRERAAATEQRDGRWMRGEVHDPRAYRLGGIAGHAGLFSTCEDLGRYAQMLLQRGRYGDVRVFVAGTDEAQEAVLDTYIPQTAAVECTRTVEVAYDGAPSFQPIGTTGIFYAFNAPLPVLKVDGSRAEGWRPTPSD